MVRLQFYFVPYLYVCLIFNQYNRERKVIAFLQRVNIIIMVVFIVGNVQTRLKLFMKFIKRRVKQRQFLGETRILISKICISILWKFIIVFQEVVFNCDQSSMFVNIQNNLYYILIWHEWTSSNNRCFYQGT